MPVAEEEAVVGKQAVAKEEVRVRKDVVEDNEVVEEDVAQGDRCRGQTPGAAAAPDVIRASSPGRAVRGRIPFAFVVRIRGSKSGERSILDYEDAINKTSDGPLTWSVNDECESETSQKCGGLKEELMVQRSEEEVRGGVREREAGSVNVRKSVHTEREVVEVPSGARK